MRRDFTYQELGPELQRTQKRIMKAAVRGNRKAAHDGRREVIEQINYHWPHPVVDLGQLKRSPKVTKLRLGAALEVTAPHAAPQEFGTRPYTPPLKALIDWAERKLRRSRKSTPRGGKGRSRDDAKRKASDAKASASKRDANEAKTKRPKKQAGPSAEARRMGGAVWAKIRREGVEKKEYYSRASLKFDSFVYQRVSAEVAGVKH